MRVKAFVIAVMTLCAASLPSQPSRHERTGIASIPPIEASLESSLRVAFPDGTDSLLWLWPSVCCDIVVGGSFYAAIEIPFAARLDLAANAEKTAVAALGDLVFSTGGSLRAGRWLVSAELRYAHPTGIWYAGNAEAAGIRSGGGYSTFGATLGAILHSDPLMLGCSLAAEASLPRNERFGSVAGPMSATIRFFATEALNGRVALSAGLSGGLGFSRRLESPGDAISASFAGSVSLIVSGMKGSLRVGISRLLSDPNSATFLEAGCSRRIAGKG